MNKSLKEAIKKGLALIGVNPKKITKLYRRYRQISGHEVAYNVNQTSYEKYCLLQYIVQPFLDNNGYAQNSHQNQWQVVALAEEIGKFGYNVDVRNWDDRISRLKNYYDLVIDIYPGFNDTYRERMKSGCRRIAYLTGMNPSVANRNEQMRLNDLLERRGTVLPSERQTAPLSRDIEAFDAFFYIGNLYNLESFDEFHLPPVYFIRNTGYSFLFSIGTERKNPKNFLFFASSGQVHKGLDLLLEIFSKKGFPFELYVCSNFESEEAFCEVYKKELFSTPNIHPVGFIDIMSEKFCELAKICSFALLPSCSEARAGSVLTVMSAGIIPIVSRECGFEDDEVIQLPDCKLETIEEAVRCFGEKDTAWIEKESNHVRQIVRERYSNDVFMQSVRDALQNVIEKKPKFKRAFIGRDNDRV